MAVTVIIDSVEIQNVDLNQVRNVKLIQVKCCESLEPIDKPDGVSKPDTEKKYGDVTGNGEISVQDAIMVLRHIVGLIELDTEQLVRAMVSGGESLTVQDAIQILRHIVGLINKFPVER